MSNEQAGTAPHVLPADYERASGEVKLKTGRMRCQGSLFMMSVTSQNKDSNASGAFEGLIYNPIPGCLVKKGDYVLEIK